MVRRVKSYLKNIVVVEDESKLNEMSLQCEPVPCECLSASCRHVRSPPVHNSVASLHEIKQSSVAPKNHIALT